jgi:hypothetical protein
MEVQSSVKEICVVIKWSGKEYPINDLTEIDTVAVIKHEIFKRTQVRPERQKLLNLKFKGKLCLYLSFLLIIALIAIRMFRLR